MSETEARPAAGPTTILQRIVEMNMSGVRPFIRLRREARSHRILPHVVPLFGVTVGRADHVIEKPMLPQRAVAALHAEKPLGGPFLPSPNKVAQILSVA